MMHPVNDYVVGQMVRIEADFRNEQDVLTNPEQVTIQVRRPAGDTQDLSSQNVETGKFEATVVVDQPGTWFYRATGSGAVTAAREQHFRVLKSRFDTDD